MEASGFALDLRQSCCWSFLGKDLLDAWELAPFFGSYLICQGLLGQMWLSASWVALLHMNQFLSLLESTLNKMHYVSDNSYLGWTVSFTFSFHFWGWGEGRVCNMTDSENICCILSWSGCFLTSTALPASSRDQTCASGYLVWGESRLSHLISEQRPQAWKKSCYNREANCESREPFITKI